MKAIRSVPLPSNRPLPHLWGVEPASSVKTNQANLNTDVAEYMQTVGGVLPTQ
jgi:hypothetical protein